MSDKLSKFIALILRHDPSAAGITVDPFGWANVADMIKGINAAGIPCNDSDIENVVDYDAKMRYSFSPDGTKIRANQGHSIKVDLGLQPLTPPAVLYHGTAERFTDPIWEYGITKQSRQYVHLSDNFDTAVGVGRRHGKPVVLSINAEKMYTDGFKFFKSDNGVWLTEHVPSVYFKDQKNG